MSVSRPFSCEYGEVEGGQYEWMIAIKDSVDEWQDFIPAMIVVHEMLAHHGCKLVDGNLKVSKIHAGLFLGTVVNMVKELTKGCIQEGDRGDSYVLSGTVVKDTMLLSLIHSEHARLCNVRRERTNEGRSKHVRNK